MTRRAVIWLTVLSLLGFSLRMGIVIANKGWKDPQAMEHKSIAVSLLTGNGFAFGDFGYYGPSSVQSPPYPLLLAGLFKITGGEVLPNGTLTGADRAFFAAMVINSLAGATTIWMTFLLARTLGGTEFMGLLAAAACTVWPTQLYIARYAQAIAIITLAMTSMMVLFYQAVRTGKRGPWIAYSIIACIASLSEPVLLPATVFSGLMVLGWKTLPFKLRVRNGFILFFAAFVILGPWTVRNYIVHGKFIPVKNTMWVNIWKGNNEFATGTDRLPITSEQQNLAKKNLLGAKDDAVLDPKADPGRQYDLLDAGQKNRLHNQPEAKREEAFKQFATDWIREHPDRYAYLCGVRLLKTIWIDWDNPKSYNAAFIASRGFLVLTSFIGLIMALRRRWSLIFPALVIGCCYLTYTLTVTAARFSIPIETTQFCLSALFLATVMNWIRGKKDPPTQAGEIEGKRLAKVQA